MIFYFSLFFRFTAAYNERMLHAKKEDIVLSFVGYKIARTMRITHRKTHRLKVETELTDRS